MILDDEGRAYCYHCRLENDDYVFVPRDGSTHILGAFDGGDELRFRIGDTVACLYGDRWSLGKVTKHWYRDENDERWPYQVRLNDGSLIFTPCDHNESICTEEDAEALTELMQEKLMQSERETVLVCSAPKQKKKKKKKKKRGKGQGPPNLQAESSLESIESVESVESVEETEPVAEAEASDDENDGCVVCFEADKTHLSVTCGHLCVCERCSAKLSACPVCRVPSPQWLRVFKV
tara:strand:+ start:962 stop:1666 length:705 start_codon:yes stop_codon:yes gene_type:complete